MAESESFLNTNTTITSTTSTSTILISEEFNRLTEYLSPNWTPYTSNKQEEREERENKNENNNLIIYSEYSLIDDKNEVTSITELVATEIHNYILSFLHIYNKYKEHLIEEEEIQLLIIEIIKNNAINNSNYCKKIIDWITKVHLYTNLNVNCNSSESILSHIISLFNMICDEYMKHSPGPWREAILLEAIRGLFFPTLCRQLINLQNELMLNESQIISHSSDLDENNRKKLNDTTLSVSVSEGDDDDNDNNDTLSGSHSTITKDSIKEGLIKSIKSNTNTNINGIEIGIEQEIRNSNNNNNNTNNNNSNTIKSNDLDFDSISSVGHSEDIGDNISIKSQIGQRNRIRSGDSVSSRNILQNRNIKSNKGEIPPRSNSQVINRLKGEIAILQGELVKAQAVDKTILQNKLIEYRLDINNLRERNKELSEQLSETNNQLFRALMDPLHKKILNPIERKIRVNQKSNKNSNSNNNNNNFFEVDDEMEEEIGEEIEETTKKNYDNNEDEEIFEDAREETSLQTQTSSEDKQSINESEVEHQIKSRNHNNINNNKSQIATKNKTIIQNSKNIQNENDENLRRNENIEKMIELYEKQFERLNSELRYLRLLTKKHPQNVITITNNMINTNIGKLPPVNPTNNLNDNNVNNNNTTTTTTTTTTNEQNTINIPVKKEKNIKSYSLNEVNKLINDALKESKEISEKVNKEMLVEINSLKNELLEKDKEINEMKENEKIKENSLKEIIKKQQSIIDNYSKSQMKNKNNFDQYFTFMYYFIFIVVLLSILVSFYPYFTFIKND